MSTAVIFNPNAGSADQMKALREKLERQPNVTILETKQSSDSVTFTRAAIENGADTIVAAGGDGTVNQVAGEILRGQRDVTFGILPLGTGNDLARTLQIPLDALEAIDLLQSGQRRKIDVMKVSFSG